MQFQANYRTWIGAALLLWVIPSISAEQKPANASSAATHATPAARNGKAVATTKIKLVDINSASFAEIKTLPGMTDESAKKIIAGRPFGSKAQLTTRGLLTREVYENLKRLVIAGQDKGSVEKLVKK